MNSGPDSGPEDIDRSFDLAFGNGFDREAVSRLKRDIERADGMGMRPGVFAKIGDSNLTAFNAVYGLGCRSPVWGDHEWLKPVMRRYRETALPAGDGPENQIPPPGQRKPWNSFSRSSAAARSGIHGNHLLEPAGRFASHPLGWLPDPDCPPEVSLLDFEIGLVKPRLALLNVGSNAIKYGMSSDETGEQVGRLIEEIRHRGPVPIVFTIPPQLEEDGSRTNWNFAREASLSIAETARAKGALVFDQWLLLSDERLVNHGLIEFEQGRFDGLHLETFGGVREPDSLRRSVDFRPPALLYGVNLRNLLLLRTLDAIDAVL